MSNNDIDIHMSDLDEETKRILAEVESQSSRKDESDDSKDKSKKSKKANDDYNVYETNTMESKDEDW